MSGGVSHRHAPALVSAPIRRIYQNKLFFIQSAITGSVM